MTQVITNQSLTTADQQVYLPAFKRFPLAFESGVGSRLRDADGNEYIDMLAGIAVNSVGHSHPKLLAALCAQSEKLWHISNFFVSQPQVELSEKLVEISEMDRVFLTNSGAESVEGAIKVARKWASKNNRGGKVISMTNSFHGRTLATIATGQKKFQRGFEPIPDGFSQVPFGDSEALAAVMSDNVAAVILEVVQGEGGVIPASAEYLQKVRDLCHKNGSLLIIDEIQTGIGRSGEWFAYQQFGVKPDVVTLAKGLGGGFPVGAFLCTEQVAQAIDFGDHGTTFGGNPLACAASLATLEIIENEGLRAAAEQKGQRIRDFFEREAKSKSRVDHVRGMGLMLGVALKTDALPVVKKLLDAGVVANATAGNVLRLLPPLNIPDEDLEEALQIIDKTLQETNTNK